MKNKNKSFDLKEEQNSNSPNEYMQKENIIKDLKNKGYNQIQIDEILETFIRNSLYDKSPFIQNMLINNQEKRTLDADIHKKENNSDAVNISKNSKFKNSIFIKSELNLNPKGKINSKYNCSKLYINDSSDKKGELFLNANSNKYISKIVNIKKYRNVPHVMSSNTNTETYVKKINPKFGYFNMKEEENQKNIENNRKFNNCNFKKFICTI